jgi:hypothetical protein
MEATRPPADEHRADTLRTPWTGRFGEENVEREFTYTKEKLRFILSEIIAQDVRGAVTYLADDRAEEGFEKRAVLEFLLWFIDEAYPDGFSFVRRYDELEDEYPATAAHLIAQGSGWANKRLGEEDASGKVVFVDFKKRR